MAIDIGRRQFISALGSAASLAWPLTARAQQPPMSVLGLLSAGTADGSTSYIAGLQSGLAENGYVEGRNITIDYRFAEGHFDRFPKMAAELVGRNVNVIAAFSPAAALAAKTATTGIPIVFSIGSDPVKFGLVASFNHPGGNLTGVNFFANSLEAKRLVLFHELVPKAALLALLVNPNNADAAAQLDDLQAAAQTIGQKIIVQNARSEDEIGAAFATLLQRRAEALFVVTDAFLGSQRNQLVALAARHAIPTMYFSRDFADVGGLMSYGTSIVEAYRQTGVYVGKILKGAKPADLPVVQPTKFELVINLKTAKALGLDIPAQLLARADEVIE
jgi:putative ABC transport system substrate-binding protein